MNVNTAVDDDDGDDDDDYDEKIATQTLELKYARCIVFITTSFTYTCNLSTEP